MPRYIPVTRVITVEFRPVAVPKGRLEVVVTPEYAVIRSDDTIRWDVQGLPASATVTVGNFTAFCAASTVKLDERTVKLGKPKVMRDEDLKIVKGLLTYDTKGVDLGAFTYDVIVDGKVVCDPDVEIKGPRNG